MPSDAPDAKALLSFSLGPVQPFIAGARTVRDLWSGSYLLSWLTFQAAGPVRRARGELLFPALDGNPLVELEQGRQPETDQLLTPCLPNRFTALVAVGEAKDLAAKCEAACRKAWEEVCSTVHGVLNGEVTTKALPHAAGWDRLWSQQVASFFEIRTAVLPCKDADAATLERLLGGPLAGADEGPRLYMGRMELLGRLTESVRSVRHVPPYAPAGDVPQKCTLLGTYEQMGPAPLRESRAFWEAFAARVRHHGTHTRKNERLCALSLVKRFAWTAYFATRLDLPRGALGYPDTHTVAATVWLRADPAKETNALDPDEAKRRRDNPEHAWNGQWLHWSRPSQVEDEGTCPPSVFKDIGQKRDRQGQAPSYYAILMMDGDDMGRWLRGEKGLALGHQLHLRLSRALTGFALKDAPQVIEKDHAGTLIYAGGDDVLALLPTRQALSCAFALQERYRANWGETVGGKKGATVSAGLAVVHRKEDLRFALDAARGAEAAAKRAGKNALTVRVCRRSGEHSSATVPWEQVPALDTLVNHFAGGISDRWTYHLRTELPALAGDGVPLGAFTAEARRLLNRLDARAADRARLIATVKDFLEQYVQAMRGPARGQKQSQALEGFVALCQAASFLARGRDE